MLCQERVSAIQKIPKLRNEKGMLSFIGLASYCCNFIINYSLIETPLSQLVHGKKTEAL